MNMREKWVFKTIRIPIQMYQRIQELRKRLDYASDSELIRAAIREFLNKHEKGE